MNLDKGRAVGELLERITIPYVFLFWSVVTWYTITLEMSRAKFAALILGGSIIAYAIFEAQDSLKEGEIGDGALLLVASGYTTFFTAYVIQNFDTLFFVRTGYALSHEYIMGALLLTVIIYLTYREFGLAFTGVVLFVVGYAYWGNYFPGLLNHSGFSWRRILIASVLDFGGVYGSLTQLVAVWITMLLLYAGLLRGYGAFDLIRQVAAWVASFTRSGVAQAAVVASLIIGMITGAAVANAAMTGSFTIPMMKERGIKGKTAAGIEAVASAGGQVMPPIMAATAFVMAALLSMSYIDVVIAGIIPALIFYISVAVGVHYTAVSQLNDVEEKAENVTIVEEKKARDELIAEGVKFLVPFFILIWALGIARYTVSTAGLYASTSMVAFGIGVPLVQSVLKNEDVKSTLKKGINETIEGMRYGLKLFAPILIIIAVVNGIVDILNATGMPGVFALYLLNLSGGEMIFAMILALIICIILGMGMPTVAAYTIVALLVAPTLTGEFGVPVLAAHFFVFYAAMLSGITPPIAMNVIVTTGIAGSNFWSTAFEAVKIAVTLFILPFAFIYNPEIITETFSIVSLYSSLLMLIGAISLVHSLNFVVPSIPRVVGYIIRIAYFGLGIILLVYPGEIGRTIATVAFLALFIGQRYAWGIHQPKEVSATTESMTN